MKIVMIASEAIPFAKTGGLADVLGALPKALGQLGHQVFVFIPFYRGINERAFAISPTGKHVRVHIDGKNQDAELFEAHPHDNVTAYLVRHEGYYGRSNFYQDRKGDYADNAQRFAFLARATLDAILALDIEPDIIHAHDWQGALALYYAATKLRNDPTIQKAKRILTIHNIGYQGLFPKEVLTKIDLDHHDFTIEGIEYYGKVNFLKAGIVAANAITTVSKSHAKEILTEQYGFGLHGVLATRRKDIHGILNGLDDEVWNPATDQLIESMYTPDDLGGKVACKGALQRKFDLPARADTPVIGMVGRLTMQKGIDLLCRALKDIMKRDVQLIILGTGEEKYHKLLTTAATDYRLSMRLELAFNNQTAHQIEAGADFFMMPSLYEPCGLNQMISMKYGTIPIVRATGGLDDTVENFNPQTWGGSGFKFTEPTPGALLACINEALTVWGQPVLRNKLIKNIMDRDFSWSTIADQYLNVYRKLG